jgi:DNA-binding phage protein
MKTRTLLSGAGVAAAALALNVAFSDLDGEGGRQSLRAPASAASVTQVIASRKTEKPLAHTQTTAPLQDQAQSREIEVWRLEIQRLRACYEGECGYARTYPRDYDFAVGRDLKKALFGLQDLVEREGVVNEEIARLARENLANEDGHVKEAALHLLATQAPSPENLQSILRDVLQENDAALIAHAMLELQRYKSPIDLTSIREALAQAMLTGAPFVSEAVSKSIVSFIDNESYPYFFEIATQISPGSVVKTNLQFSLMEFRRRNSA